MTLKGQSQMTKTERTTAWSQISRGMTPEQKQLRSAKTKRWQAAHPEQTRQINKRGKLKRAFGLDFEEYERLLVAQQGVCAICKNPETERIRGVLRSLAVDHDHVTGKVRGLLCHNCNLGLGRLKDDVLLLTAAIRYLEGGF